MKISKILVSQPKPASDKSPYYDIARKFGVEVVFRPFIKVEGLSAKEFRQQKISLADYTAIIFTSRGAVDHFFRIAEEMRYPIPDTLKYFCTSEAIALYLQKYIVYRKRKIFYADSGKLEDLIPLLQKHNKEKYLFVISNVNMEEANQLDKANIHYTKAVMYRTVSNDFEPGEQFDYDMLVFFSPQGIQSLKKNFPNFEQGDIRIATFGAATARSVNEAGLRLDIEAPTPTAPSMPAAIEQYLKENASSAPHSKAV